MSNSEGVIKYQLDFTRGTAPDSTLISEINAWRHIFVRLQLIGQDDKRYEGLGYGNVSCRQYSGDDKFIITGTQTAHLPQLTAEQFVLITGCDVTNNRIAAFGAIEPSSEALTHGILYQYDAGINVVFHVHSPQIWRNSKALQIDATASNVSYGTPDMALEIIRLLKMRSTSNYGIFTMGGHEDGVIVFGGNAQQAGSTLVNSLVKALQC